MANIQGIELPWAESGIPAAQLDMLFFYRHGLRPISSFTRSYIADDGTISAQRLPEIASHLYNINANNWSRLWAAYTAEYNPVHNYDMTEIETLEQDDTFGKTETRTLDTEDEYSPRSVITESDTFGHATTRTLDTAEDNTRTLDTEHIKTPRSSVETDGSFYGFNSATDVPTGKSVVTGVGGEDTDADTGTITDEKTDTGTITDEESGTNTHTTTGTSGSDTTTHTGTDTLEHGGTDTRESERTLTRSGNIGVTTSAQMIQQEIELWVWNYFDSVFADVCKYLAIPIY